jgi:hypothetical protein
VYLKNTAVSNNPAKELARLSFDNEYLRNSIKSKDKEIARLKRIIDQLKAGRETTARRAQRPPPDQFRGMTVNKAWTSITPEMRWRFAQMTGNNNKHTVLGMYRRQAYR